MGFEIINHRLVTYIEEADVTLAIIPEDVREIGELAFRDCQHLETVVFPEGVRYIERNQFFECRTLKHVILPKSLESIEAYAFYGCSGLTEIRIPEGVTFIGHSAFKCCEHLEKIIVSEKMKAVFEKEVFSGTAWLENYQEPAVILNHALIKYNGSARRFVIPENIRVIAENAFEDCNTLEEVIIPEGVEWIGKEAFCHAGLKRVRIPGSVKFIGKWAFTCDNLEDVQFDEHLSAEFEENVFRITPWLYSWQDEFVIVGNQILLLYKGFDTHIEVPPNTRQIAGKAFSKNIGIYSRIKSVTIPDSVTNIAEDAFYYCSNLEKIIFHGVILDVKSMKDEASHNCPNCSGGDFYEMFDGVLWYCFNFILGKATPGRLYFLDSDKVNFSMAMQMVVNHIEDDTITAYLEQNAGTAFAVLAGDYPADRHETAQKLLDSGKIITQDNIDDVLQRMIDIRAHELFVMLLHYKNEHLKYTDVNEKFRL